MEEVSGVLVRCIHDTLILYYGLGMDVYPMMCLPADVLCCFDVISRKPTCTRRRWFLETRPEHASVSARHAYIS